MTNIIIITISNFALLENVFYRESKMQGVLFVLHLNWNVMPACLPVQLHVARHIDAVERQQKRRMSCGQCQWFSLNLGAWYSVITSKTTI
jgi:hypothetical protein